MTGTRTYFAWHKAKRSGLMCRRWRSLQAFLKDMGVRPLDTILARIDANKGYEPGNCYWKPQKDRQHRKLLAHLSLK